MPSARGWIRGSASGARAGMARLGTDLQLRRAARRTGKTTPARRLAGLLQHVGAGLGDLRVLLGRHAGDANGTNDSVIDDDWDPAFKRTRACKRQQTEVRAALRRKVLESCGRAPVQNSGVRFLARRRDAAELGAVEAVDCHHVTA